MELNRENFDWLLSVIKGRTSDYHTVNNNGGIYLRHDIDDKLDNSVLSAQIEADNGIYGEYFVLNTTKYWNNDLDTTLRKLVKIQEMGHKIGWHNNVLSEFICYNKILQRDRTIEELITLTIGKMRMCGLKVSGSASHGSELCKYYNFANYEVWKEFPKQPENKLTYRQVSMKDFGIEYEAYKMEGSDYYLGDSGGKINNEYHDIISEWHYLKSKIDSSKKIKITLHPQHWTL